MMTSYITHLGTDSQRIHAIARRFPCNSRLQIEVRDPSNVAPCSEFRPRMTYCTGTSCSIVSSFHQLNGVNKHKHVVVIIFVFKCVYL